MSLLIDTDDEMNRYDEAALYSRTVKPDMAPGIRSSFNVGTGRTDLMAPLPSGGFVTLASNAPDIMVEAPAMPGMGADAALPVEGDEFLLESIRDYSASGEVPITNKDGKQVGTGNSLSRDDFLLAGYTDQQIDASGVMGETQQKSGRTEPLSFREIETILREGGSLFSNYSPTMRENGAADLTETLMEISVDRRREELLEQMKNSEADTEALNFKIDQVISSERPEMLSLAENLTDAVFGNKNVLGTGLADFATAGVMDMQEGYRMLEAGMSFNGTATQRGLGILLIAAGVAEATGVGFALGKAIKASIPFIRASIPKIQSAMASAGQNAEMRMAERGPAVDFLANSMMSGVPVDVVTDPLVAAAGRAVGDGKMSSKAQDAASKLSEEFGVDFNVSNHPTSYGNSTYVSGRIAGPDGTFVDVGFRLSDHSTGDKRKATDDFLTIIDDGEVTAETLVAEVQGQLDRALPKMQKMSDDREAKAIAQSDALSRWSELSGDERGEIAVKFNEKRPKRFNNVPWKNLTKQQKADFAAREGLDKD